MLYIGTLVSFNSTAYTAVVELRGSKWRRLTDIPCSRGLASAAFVAGRLVAVWMVGAGDSYGEAVVIAVW